MINYPFNWHQRSKILLARSLFHINGDNDSNFRKLIEHELKRLDRENRKEPDKVLFRQRQGACQVLDDLIDMLEGASEMHDTLKKNENYEQKDPYSTQITNLAADILL